MTELIELAQAILAELLEQTRILKKLEDMADDQTIDYMVEDQKIDWELRD